MIIWEKAFKIRIIELRLRVKIRNSVCDKISTHPARILLPALT